LKKLGEKVTELRSGGAIELRTWEVQIRSNALFIQRGMTQMYKNLPNN
jgi:hypothetical protein